MLRNKKYKSRRAEERVNFVENAKKNRCDNNDMSELYSSFGDNMVFDTRMINSIKNEPDFTDIKSNPSSHGLNVVSGV
jgi:hypothetical protein